jgi:hypothetical protein
VGTVGFTQLTAAADDAVDAGAGVGDVGAFTAHPVTAESNAMLVPMERSVRLVAIMTLRSSCERGADTADIGGRTSWDQP